MVKRITYFALVLGVFFQNLYSRQGNKLKEEPAGKAIFTTEHIMIDGKLGEEAWKSSEGISGFIQLNPIENNEPSEKTVVYVLYDEAAIYFGVELFDSQPDSIIARFGRKDDDVSSDDFTIYIDPYNDKRSGYYFSITAGGGLSDGILFNDNESDISWDGVWEGKAEIISDCWTAEIRIPFSQLRFKSRNQTNWGINFKRSIARKKETDYLVITPKNSTGFVSRFKPLDGMVNISVSDKLELKPYILAKGEYFNSKPQSSTSAFKSDIGFDFSYHFTPNLTLNGAINPDFGQAEADPAVVNISDVETYFEEKRSFFLEGASIFNFGKGGANTFPDYNFFVPMFFYSRRIGSKPQNYYSGVQENYLPSTASILGAAKLSGKINDWNVGTLHALTGIEYGNFSVNSLDVSLPLQPPTYYGVLRIQKEFEEGKQGFGLFTGVTLRDLNDEILKGYFNKTAVAFGLDGWTFLDKSNTWVLSGWGGLTTVNGSVDNILRLQRSSQHYLQRPDLKTYRLDSNATSLTGFAARIWLIKQKGNLLFNAAFGLIDPKFDINDIGFQQRTDRINGHVQVGYKWIFENQFLQQTQFNLTAFRSYDFDGDPTWAGFVLENNTIFSDLTSFDLSVEYSPYTLNNRRSRGGPMMENNPQIGGELSYTSNKSKEWIYGLSIDGGKNFKGEDEWFDFGPSVEWHPTPNFSISFNPVFGRYNTVYQYVGEYTDQYAESTFGKRYVFADFTQTSLSTNIRLNFSLSPTINLQAYIQPLFSSGDYSGFKELLKPKTNNFLKYGEGNSTFNKTLNQADPDGEGPAPAIQLPNNDFNISSLIGNFVLRWEFNPGSTIYLIWTQTRSIDNGEGIFNLNSSYKGIVNAPADNIFMMKFNYWFTM